MWKIDSQRRNRNLFQKTIEVPELLFKKKIRVLEGFFWYFEGNQLPNLN